MESREEITKASLTPAFCRETALNPGPFVSMEMLLTTASDMSFFIITGKKIYIKSTYQQGLLGQTIPIEAPQKPVIYQRTIGISSWFTDTEETIYSHILQDVYCFLYMRRSKDVLHKVTANVIRLSTAARANGRAKHLHYRLHCSSVHIVKLVKFEIGDRMEDIMGKLMETALECSFLDYGSICIERREKLIWILKTKQQFSSQPDK
jgi:hypothetical protein